MVEITRHPDDYPWEPYFSHGHERVTETSCCGAYEWVSSGGEYVILRRTPGGRGYQETGRGRYVDARLVWHELMLAHRAKHGTSRAGVRRQE